MRYPNTAPVDPTDALAQRIKRLEAEVAELQRANRSWFTSWGEVGYAQITSASSAFTTLADVSGLSVAVDVVDGRKYQVRGHGNLTSTVSGDVLIVRVRIGTTQYGRIANERITANGAETTFDGHSIPITGLAAGSTTFKLSAERSSGSGSATINAGSAFPAFIQVLDVGPA